jgi:hypothetical protein
MVCVQKLFLANFVVRLEPGLTLALPPPGRLLCVTKWPMGKRNSARCWQTKDFVEDFVYTSQEAERYLAAQQVPLFNLEFFQEQLLRQTSELGINYRMSSLSQSHDWQHLWLPDGLSE